MPWWGRTKPDASAAGADAISIAAWPRASTPFKVVDLADPKVKRKGSSGGLNSPGEAVIAHGLSIAPGEPKAERDSFRRRGSCQAAARRH